MNEQVLTEEAFIMENFFAIADKKGNDVPFILNDSQRRLDADLTGRDIIPKARQEGISSYFLGRYTAACINQRNVRAVIISHDAPSTQRLLKRCHYFVQNFRGDEPPVTRNMSANEITFPKTNSMIYIGTAGAKNFGRGDTITHLHCSEYAYWPNAKALLSGLIDAVPLDTGEIAIESTGNGIGNDYYQRCMRAYSGGSSFKMHFFSWIGFHEYQVALTDDQKEYLVNNLSVEWGETSDPDNEDSVGLFEQGVSLEQLAWRRIKLEEKDFDIRMLMQEYPATLDECFQSTGSSIFHKINYIPTLEWKDQGNHLHILGTHPLPGAKYCIGADPSGGVGKDNAAAEIIWLEGNEQVGEYAHNMIEPDIFGEHLADLAILFNQAYVVVEANNHGPVTLGSLRDNYDDTRIYAMQTASAKDVPDPSLMQLGLRTTTRTRPLMIGNLRTELAHGFIIHSPLLKGELDTFIENASGKMEAEEGCHDDTVMALAQGMMGVDEAIVFAGVRPGVTVTGEPFKDPFLLDNIIEEMKDKQGGRFPIREQHTTN